MPLADGTNDEREDPLPPLKWTCAADIKDCKVYGSQFSPPCYKVLLILKYYKIPCELIEASAGNPVVPNGSYKKIPVLIASGRTVNDSSVIVKELLKACAPEGDQFDADLNDAITFGLQPAIECDVLSNSADLKAIAMKMVSRSLYLVPGFLLVKGIGNGITGSIKKKNPDMLPALDYGTRFKASLHGKPYHGGDAPDGMDLSYFGTVFPFHNGAGSVVDEHLKAAGLMEWYLRMGELMPPAYSLKSKYMWW